MEKTQFEAELAKWAAAQAKLEYETELINYRHQLDGVYSFHREVSQKSVNKLLRAMKLWHDTDPQGSWSIYLNSVGGDIVSGSALLDELFVHSLRGGGTHHITIKVRGEAASMGSALLQAADTRLMGPSAYLMIHEPSGGTEGTVHDMRTWVEWLERWWERTACPLYAERSRYDVETIRTKSHKQDWWLSATEAVEVGLADAIG